MTRALDYAVPPATSRFSPGRLMLWLVYYAGWAAGWAVLGIVAAVALYETFRPQGIPDDVAFTGGPIVGGVAGVLCAVLARRSRWPQVILVIVGAFASVPFATRAWSVYGGRIPRGWDALALLIYCVFLAASLSFLLSGTAGLLLNRRTSK